MPRLRTLLLMLALSACATGGNLSTHDEPPIAGRTYVLLGASSGLGRGTALKLAALHANIVIAARRGDLLRDIAARAEAMGAQALAVPTDISRPEDVERLRNAAVARFGHVDTWIDFAGVAAIGPFWEVPLADHARVIDVNLKGFVFASYAAVNLFRQQGYGTLINLGSVESEIPIAYHASYAATKAGIRNLDLALGQELRLAGLSRIKVVTIEPWAVATPFWAHAADYTGKAPCMGTMDEPGKVVDAIIWSSLYPQPDLPVGWKAQAAWFGAHVSPWLTDRIAAAVIQRYQINDSRPMANTDGNLFAPVAAGRGTEGEACRPPDPAR